MLKIDDRIEKYKKIMCENLDTNKITFVGVMYYAGKFIGVGHCDKNKKIKFEDIIKLLNFVNMRDEFLKNLKKE